MTISKVIWPWPSSKSPTRISPWPNPFHSVHLLPWWYLSFAQHGLYALCRWSINLRVFQAWSPNTFKQAINHTKNAFWTSDPEWQIIFLSWMKTKQRLSSLAHGNNPYKCKKYIGNSFTIVGKDTEYSVSNLSFYLDNNLKEPLSVKT